ALLLALVGYLWLGALSGDPTMILAASATTAMSWLIYARLLGRLAYKITRLRPIKAKVKKQKKAPTRKPRPEERALEVTDPRATPGEGEAEPEPARPLPAEEQPVVPEKKPRSLLLDEEPEPYVLSDEAPPPLPTFIPLDGHEPEEVEEIAPPDPK